MTCQLTIEWEKRENVTEKYSTAHSSTKGEKLKNFIILYVYGDSFQTYSEYLQLNLVVYFNLVLLMEQKGWAMSNKSNGIWKRKKIEGWK